MILAPKIKKYVKSKNAIERRLGAFNEELWAISFFPKSRKFRNLRAVSLQEQGSENLIPGKASQSIRNLVTFPKKCNQKRMISAQKTLKIHKVQKFPQKSSRML